MCFATTGIPNSHTYTFLSSAVETKRRPFSMKVSVLIDPRCSSYCCTMSFELVSNCKIFLFAHPAKKMCCLSSAGWNFTQKGVLRLVKLRITFPVSVSQS